MEATCQLGHRSQISQIRTSPLISTEPYLRTISNLSGCHLARFIWVHGLGTYQRRVLAFWGRRPGYPSQSRLIRFTTRRIAGLRYVFSGVRAVVGRRMSYITTELVPPPTTPLEAQHAKSTPIGRSLEFEHTAILPLYCNCSYMARQVGLLCFWDPITRIPPDAKLPVYHTSI